MEGSREEPSRLFKMMMGKDVIRRTSKSIADEKIFIIFSCLILLAISCRRQKETYEIKIVDGVKTINNLRPKWGAESKIKLEFVRKIGGVEIEDENYIFYRPFDMVQDEAGNKYILTGGGDTCIRKFDSDWKYLKRFGGRGEGPGEVHRTFGCAIDNQSNLYVLSHQNRRVVILSPEGEVLGNIKMPDQSFDAAVLSSGQILLTAKSFYANGLEAKNTENATSLALIDLDGEINKRFVKCKIFDETSLLFFANEVFFDVDDEDNIYVTFRFQNRIEKYSPDGALVFSAKRPLKYEIKHSVDTTSKFRWPRATHVSNCIKIDDKGRLWVTTYDKQPESQGTTAATLKDRRWLKFEIYDKEGVLLGQIPAPVEFYKKRIDGDTLYLIDPYFEACVYEYRIVEK